MKHTKHCPKCGSTDIICFVNDGFPSDSKVGIMTGATIFSAVRVNRYICCNCTYTEEWVDRSNIDTLKQSKKGRPINE